MSLNSQKQSQHQANLYADDSASIFEATILVVDDSALIRELIGACLLSAGYTDIRFAENGEAALEKIEEHIPDLIILDLEMPIMDGFEVCKRLRSRPETKSLPILIQSGRDTAADITKAFEFGATDMVVKPIKKFEILARTKVHLENQIFVAKLTAFHNRVANELEQARRLQLDICPTPEELEKYRSDFNLEIGWHYEPSSELGGDIGGIFPISETKIAFYIADFSGHGVAASLNTFRLQTWLASAKDLYETPDKLMTELNTFLNGSLSLGSYATMLFFCLDLENDELVYSAAGCQPPLIQHPNISSEFKHLSSKGMPLGLRPKWDYEASTISFEEDSKIMLYSDALVEVKTETGEFLGEEGLLQEVNEKSSSELKAEPLITSLVSKFHKRLGNDEADDLTIIYLSNRNAKDAGK